MIFNLSDDHIHRLIETFEEIDADKTGTITDEGKSVVLINLSV